MVPEVRAGVSPVVDGLAQVDVGQALAATALRALPAGRDEVVELDALLPGALLVTAPDLAGRLVRRALGGVLELEPASATCCSARCRPGWTPAVRPARPPRCSTATATPC